MKCSVNILRSPCIEEKEAGLVLGWLSQSMELLSIGLFSIMWLLIWHIFMNEWIKNKHWPFCKQCLPIPVCLCVSQVYLHCFRFCMPRQGNRFMKNITYLKKFESTKRLISTKMWFHNKKTNHNCCIYNCIGKYILIQILWYV